ncbi:MAG: flavin reductase family protein [Porphyromonas sp.]|nr:flavin reductase family protein [Porphyromonas sp.]
MSRVNWKPGTLVYPLPAVLVSCGRVGGEMNMFTASWCGTICTNPPMVYVSIRPERHSYSLIKEQGEFGLNLTTCEMARETDWCGVTSGRRYDKFAETNLTYEKGYATEVPLLVDSPISLECKLREIVPLGSHDMFIADVVNVRANERFIDPETGGFDMERAGLLAYAHGEYFALGEFIGHFGWSVRKDQNKGRRRAHQSKE